MDTDESFLELDKIEFLDKFALNDGQKSIIQDVISWNTQPPLVKEGRSSFLIIQEPELPFKGVKIKGCGYFDQNSNAVMQPMAEDDFEAHIQDRPDGIKEIHFQVVVDENDELKYIIPGNKPFGGQIYKKAFHEFEVCKKLLEKWEGNISKFPFYFPIAHAKYKDLFYKGEPLGVSVLGIGHDTEVTLGSYFMGNFEDKGLRINPQIIDYWQKNMAPVGADKPHYFELLQALNKLLFEFAKTMSHFHKHFVDCDPHLFNASVNNKNGLVSLFDLDHAVDVEEISDQKYFYYALKDFEIGLVALMSNFMLNGLSDGVLLFQEQNRNIEEFNLLRGYFEGYFGELNKDLSFIVKSMWKRLILICVNQLIEADYQDKLSIAHEFCEVERGTSYFELFPYFKEKLKKQRPDFDLSKAEHDKIIEKFLKQKSELLKDHNVTRN